MPFSSRDQRIHSTTDWDIMQQAHDRASKMLDRCPKTHARCNQLARIVIFKSRSASRQPTNARKHCIRETLLR
jgi:hypothetical protein